jgi:hypothetical protein
MSFVISMFDVNKLSDAFVFMSKTVSTIYIVNVLRL